MPGEIPGAMRRVRLAATPLVWAEGLKGMVAVSYTQTMTGVTLFGRLYFHLISPDVKSFQFNQNIVTSPSSSPRQNSLLVLAHFQPAVAVLGSHL